jgi:cytochrome c553
MKRCLVFSTTVVCLALSVAAPLNKATASDDVSGQNIYMHGSPEGAAPCAACHGLQARGRPGMEAPALAGRPMAILENRLTFFASGQGNAMMRIIAGKLTAGERNAVARYVSGLPAS